MLVMDQGPMPFSLYRLIMVNRVIRNLVLLIWRGEPLYPGSWFQKLFIFTPKPGEDDPFWLIPFKMGCFNHQLHSGFEFIDYFLRFCMASQEISERSTKRIGKPEWCRTSIGTGAWDRKGFTIIRRDSHTVDARNLAPPGMFRSWQINGNKLPINWCRISSINSITPLKCNITPEKWWLQDDPFLFGPGNFLRAMLNFGVISSMFGLGLVSSTTCWVDEGRSTAFLGGGFKYCIFLCSSLCGEIIQFD